MELTQLLQAIQSLTPRDFFEIKLSLGRVVSFLMQPENEDTSILGFLSSSQGLPEKIRNIFFTIRRIDQEIREKIFHEKGGKKIFGADDIFKPWAAELTRYEKLLTPDLCAQFSMFSQLLGGFVGKVKAEHSQLWRDEVETIIHVGNFEHYLLQSYNDVSGVSDLFRILKEERDKNRSHFETLLEKIAGDGAGLEDSIKTLKESIDLINKEYNLACNQVEAPVNQALSRLRLAIQDYEQKAARNAIESVVYSPVDLYNYLATFSDVFSREPPKSYLFPVNRSPAKTATKGPVAVSKEKPPQLNI